MPSHIGRKMVKYGVL